MPPKNPPARRTLSADRPYAVIDEREPDGTADGVAATTVFLTVSECPIGCNMCDLWQHTLEDSTPAGAVPRQLEAAELASRSANWLKLYNSGNFFDPRSIPPRDYAAIAQFCQGFGRIVVENHPKIGRDLILGFRDMIEAPLEIAVGLETVQPRWLSRLAKKMTRDDFDQFAKWLQSEAIALRVFLIVGMPGQSVDASVRWAKVSVRHAAAMGARHVSLIPARAGHGWNGRAAELPEVSLEELAQLQVDCQIEMRGRCFVTVDVWDIASNDGNTALLEQVKRRNVTQGTH